MHHVARVGLVLGGGALLSIKTWCIHVHAHDVFSPLDKVWGPPPPKKKKKRFVSCGTCLLTRC